jgi:hypothetical protein
MCRNVLFLQIWGIKGRAQGIFREKRRRSEHMLAYVENSEVVWRGNAGLRLRLRPVAQFGRRKFVQVVGNLLLDFSVIMWYNKPAGTAVRGRADLSTPKNST